MAYKIAVASSDNKNVDISFGAASNFLIYEVEDLEFNLLEKREYRVSNESDVQSCDAKKDCKSPGCGEGGHGCGGASGVSDKVKIIEDCRCILCKKIGFQVQKQLEKKAIASFDIECDINEGLDKIVNYLYKVDHHQSLRDSQK